MFLGTALCVPAAAFGQTGTSSATPPIPPLPGPTDPATAEEPKRQAPPTAKDDPRRPGETRGLTWTIKTGRIPDDGSIIEGEMGFSSLPRVSYHYSLGGGLSLGGMVAFDYAGNRPSDAFDSTIAFGVPVRIGFDVSGVDVGLRGMVGARRPGARGRSFALLFEVEAHAGWNVEHRLLVGGGVSIPMALSFGSGDFPGSTDKAALDVPLLIGPFAEFHVTPPLAITLDIKVGPHLSTDANKFGLRANLGVAYRF